MNSAEEQAKKLRMLDRRLEEAEEEIVQIKEKLEMGEKRDEDEEMEDELNLSKLDFD